MQFQMTDEEFHKKLSGMTTWAVVDFLKANGLKLIEKAQPGIYRRVVGTDLINIDYAGVKTAVDRYEHGVRKPEFVLDGGNREAWVMVLDKDNNPVANGQTIYLNRVGGQVT